MDPGTILNLLGLATQIGGSIYDRWGGNKEQQSQVPLWDPEQAAAIRQLLQTGLSGLVGEQGGMPGWEKQARENFQQYGLPSIAERFTGGQYSANRGASSARERALAQAGRGLETDIAAQKSNMYQNLLGLGLSPLSQTRFNQPAPGFFQSMEPASAKYFGNYFGSKGGGNNSIQELIDMLKKGG